MSGGLLSRWLATGDRADLFEERAGILEFDAGFDRPTAEHLARLEVYGAASICQGFELLGDEAPKIAPDNVIGGDAKHVSNSGISKKQGYIISVNES